MAGDVVRKTVLKSLSFVILEFVIALERKTGHNLIWGSLKPKINQFFLNLRNYISKNSEEQILSLLYSSRWSKTPEIYFSLYNSNGISNHTNAE